MKKNICADIKVSIFAAAKTVDVAQPVRALDCGSRGRGFESHLPPAFSETSQKGVSFFMPCR